MTMVIESPGVSRKADAYALIGLTPLLIGSLVLVATLPQKSAENMLTQLFVLLFVVLAGFDVITWRVPNLLVYPFIVFTLLSTALLDFSFLDNSLLGGGACLLLMFALAVIGRGTMGMGDVKAGCLAGCMLGLRFGIASLVLGFAAGAVVALPLLLLRIRSRKDSIPLTPFLAAGAIFLIVLVGPTFTQTI